MRPTDPKAGRVGTGEGQTKAHLVLHGDGVPGHVNALDGSKGSKSLANGVLPKLVIDGTHVDPAHNGQCPLPLSCHLEQDIRGERATGL